jgi:hypothetical protein
MGTVGIYLGFVGRGWSTGFLESRSNSGNMFTWRMIL